MALEWNGKRPERRPCTAHAKVLSRISIVPVNSSIPSADSESDRFQALLYKQRDRNPRLQQGPWVP